MQCHEAERDSNHLHEGHDLAQDQRAGNDRQQVEIQQRAADAARVPDYPGDEQDHHPGFEGNLEPCFLPVKTNVVQAENEGGEEEQGHADGYFAVLAGATGDQVDECQYQQ